MESKSNEVGPEDKVEKINSEDENATIGFLEALRIPVNMWTNST